MQYIAEKARLGTGRDWRADNGEEALEDLRFQLRDFRAELDRDPDDKQAAQGVKLITHWLDTLGDGSSTDELRECREDIVDELHDRDAWEWAWSIGVVLAPTVYFAHAAVGRLYTLLFGEGQA